MNAATQIEHIAMTPQIRQHVMRWGYSSLIQTIRPGKYVVGTDIVARLIPTTFKTKRAALAAIEVLLDEYKARRAN